MECIGHNVLILQCTCFGITHGFAPSLQPAFFGHHQSVKWFLYTMFTAGEA
jgi:hypothetical protein